MPRREDRHEAYWVVARRRKRSSTARTNLSAYWLDVTKERRVKVDSPFSFVVVTVGSLPPGMLPEAAPPQLLPLFTANLAAIPHLRGTSLIVSPLSPVELLELIARTVPQPPPPSQLAVVQ